MAASFVILPDDSLSAGKKIRTNTRVVGSDTVHEHFWIVQDITNDTQARVLTSDPTGSTAGLVVRNAPGSTVQNVDTELPAAAVIADSTTNPTVPGVENFNMVWDRVSNKWFRQNGVPFFSGSGASSYATLFSPTSAAETGTFTNPFFVLEYPDAQFYGAGYVQTLFGVTTSSAIALAGASNLRVFLQIQNMSDEIIYLNLVSGTAVVGEGIKLYPGWSWQRNKSTGVENYTVRAIHGGSGTKNISIIYADI